MWARGWSSGHFCPDRILSLPPKIEENNYIFTRQEGHFISNVRLKHNKPNREWRDGMCDGVYANEEAEAYQVEKEKALGERRMMGSKVFILPPAGSPDGSSCVRSEKSCSSSGSEDPPLHPQHLLALHHSGVQVRAQWWSQQTAFSARDLKQNGTFAPLSLFVKSKSKISTIILNRAPSI